MRVFRIRMGRRFADPANYRIYSVAKTSANVFARQPHSQKNEGGPASISLILHQQYLSIDSKNLG